MTAMSGSQAKPCHNCKRRRLRCDRSVPACLKCTRSGQECLGYGKLFVWAQGIASRGKMMGRSFNADDQGLPTVPSSDVTPEQSRGTDQSAVLDTTKNSNLVRSGFDKPSTSSALSVEKTGGPLPGSSPAYRRSSHNRHAFDSTTIIPFSVPPEDKSTTLQQLSPPQFLLDPHVGDLHPNLRRYIFHFTNFTCPNIMLYDLGPNCPMRSLIPFAVKYPVLLNVITAISAFHLFNVTYKSALSGQTRASKPLWNHLPSNLDDMAFFPDKSLSIIRRDALLAKQNALRLLNHSLQNLDPKDANALLGSVLLFINLELVDSGKGGWRVHVEGANSLLRALSKQSGVRRGSHLDPGISHLRKCLISDCIVYATMPSTLINSPPALLLDLPEDLESILEYAETYNYLSFPAELFRILLQAAELSHTAHSALSRGLALKGNYHDEISLLLEAVQAFDAESWSIKLQKLSPFSDATYRYHLASAHKSATCLYILRVLPRTSPLFEAPSDVTLDDINELIVDIIDHLEYIEPSNPLFKATNWATFLVGAESMDPVQWAWVAARLQDLWGVIPWGYIRNSLEMLEIIWDKKDTNAENAAGSSTWVDRVALLGTDLYFA